MHQWLRPGVMSRLLVRCDGITRTKALGGRVLNQRSQAGDLVPLAAQGRNLEFIFEFDVREGGDGIQAPKPLALGASIGVQIPILLLSAGMQKKQRRHCRASAAAGSKERLDSLPKSTRPRLLVSD
jgi:hypothetical protein